MTRTRYAHKMKWEYRLNIMLKENMICKHFNEFNEHKRSKWKSWRTKIYKIDKIDDSILIYKRLIQ